MSKQGDKIKDLIDELDSYNENSNDEICDLNSKISDLELEIEDLNETVERLEEEKKELQEKLSYLSHEQFVRYEEFPIEQSNKINFKTHL